jgi:5'-methylthioadenosine phosphorylase
MMRTGILGGSGLYELEGLKDTEWVEIDTPFGPPSDRILTGMLGGADVAFLPRHGRGHRLLPSEINHRANLYAMKTLGAERVLSVSAVGSLREELRPGDFLLPDQYFDRTKASERHTFFGNGVVAHVPFGHPVCEEWAQVVERACRQAVAGDDVRVVRGGTYVNMEGPAFSTRAESEFHRRCGFDVVGMTSLAEAKLCREAEICYASLAIVTDWDCWREEEGDVDAVSVIEILNRSIGRARRVLECLFRAPLPERTCACPRTLDSSVFTTPERSPSPAWDDLRPILARFLEERGAE